MRPLIGLNNKQAQANLSYRAEIYRRYLSNGATENIARSRADKAALKYAAQQHRYRAETIVLTESAFAYNRGAHMGIKAAQSQGLMPRCEMIWTTAGVLRTCSRCLELKGKVIGTTDESGVTLPPIHPRCRCAIVYREIKFTGALNPESIEAEKHAFRYYGLVRSMKTDCRRIANNTGFRQQDIQRIKAHVFYNEHELYDGEIARFYPSYHMAQSWQRLIDGRNIELRDIVLLNHEFLESVIESEGFNAQQAHQVAESVYNYSALIK